MFKTPVHDYIDDYNFWLVLLNMNFAFHSVGNFIIPTDELQSFFRGVGIPPTRYKLMYCGESQSLRGSPFSTNPYIKDDVAGFEHCFG